MGPLGSRRTCDQGVFDLIVPPTLLIIVGSFGPMVAAIVVAARHGGKAEVKALLGRLRFRGVAKRWFLLAAVLGSITLAPALIYLAGGGQLDSGAVLNHLVVLPLHFLIVATIGGGLDEEVGWRGMAQPRLQQHLRPVPANLALGLIWAVWHLPLWIDPNSAQAAYPFAVYTLVILGHSLVTGWLFNASGGSLLIAVVVHSFNNTFDGLRYAILGYESTQLGWQLALAGLSLGLGITVAVATKGQLGRKEPAERTDRSAEQPQAATA